MTTTAAVQQPTPQKISRPGFNAIIVNPKQKGNPILNHVHNVPWEYGDIVPDYVLGVTTCALYLSLRYHQLHPEYIYNRIQTLARLYTLRILLVSVDIDNHSDALRELTKTSVINNFTVIAVWSAPEAGRYLETYKAFENAPPTAIQERTATDYASRLVDCLTSIRSINKTDAYALVSNLGSVKRVFNSDASELEMIGGIGTKKVQRLTDAATQPFVVRPQQQSTSRTSGDSQPSVSSQRASFVEPPQHPVPQAAVETDGEAATAATDTSEKVMQALQRMQNAYK